MKLIHCKSLTIAGAVLILAACGGGGGSSTTEPVGQAVAGPIVDAPVVAPTGLAAIYLAQIKTGGGDTYPAPIANARSPANAFTSANQNPRAFATGNFGGNNCPAFIRAPSYYENYPKLLVQIWTSDCKGNFTLATDKAISGAIPVTGLADALLVGDFNKSGRDSILIIDQGLEDKNSDLPGFDGERNKLLLNQGGKLVDVTDTHLPVQALNFNHVSTMYHANVPGGQTVVLTRLGGRQMEGSGIQFLVNDGTGKFEVQNAQLPPELAFTPNTAYDSSVDYVGAGTAALLDLDKSGTPYLVVGTYSNGTAITKQNAVFIYKLVDGVYKKYATLPIPTQYASIPYTTGANATSSTISLGVSNIVAVDFAGDGKPSLAVMWEGTGITRLQLIGNDGAGNFSDITTIADVPALDVPMPNGLAMPASSIGTVSLSGDGKQQLTVMPIRPVQLSNMAIWKPVMHMVDGKLRYRDIFEGDSLSTVASYLGIGSTDASIQTAFGNFGSGKLDLMVSEWDMKPDTQGAFTLYNTNTQHVLLRK